MSPKNAASAAPPATIVPDKLLDAGEVVILAVKPSFWFVLIASAPALSAALGVAMLAYALQNLGVEWVSTKVVVLICSAVALAKIMASCVQWAGRLYVLTNVRLMRIRGVLRADIFQCPLKQVRRFSMVASPAERVLGVASIWFEVEGSTAPETAWLHLAQPSEVHQVLSETINRAGR